MINMKKLLFLAIFSSFLHACFMLEAPVYPYSVIFRNACDYDIVVTIPFGFRYEYQEYFPKAYLNFDGLPVINLKPEGNILLADGTARADFGSNANLWQEFFPEDETFTISANNNSLVLNKRRIIELLKNNEANPRNDVPEWVIYDSSLCP
jgi:hypothetical protein